MPSIHVLHIVPSIDPVKGSGPSDALVRLSRAQAKAGVKVSVAAVDLPSEVEAIRASLSGLGIELHLVGPGGGRWNKGPNAKETIRRVMHQGGVDIVHIHAMWQHLPHCAALEARRAGVPYLFRPCGMLEPKAMEKSGVTKRLFLSLVARKDLRRSAALHATANQEARNFRRFDFGARTVVVGNGVDLHEYSPTRHDAEVEAQWPQLRGKRRMLFMSRIDPIKGTANLAEAWGRLAPTHPDWQLVIAGADSGGHQRTFEAALARANVIDRTVFIGPVYAEAKKHLLSSCDVFVQPSYQENFGITIAEAMASARPVITTKGTPWHELVTRRCGWWIDIGVDPLAEAMGEAMSRSPSDLAAMGQRSRLFIEERYSWETVAVELATAYAWLLGRHEKPPFGYEPGDTIPQ